MVVAIVKFTLETKKLVEEWSRKKAKQSDLYTRSLNKREKNSNNEENSLRII